MNLKLADYRHHKTNHSSFDNALVKRAELSVKHNESKFEDIYKHVQLNEVLIDRSFYARNIPNLE